MNKISEKTEKDIRKFVLEGIDLTTGRYSSKPDPFWQSLTQTGTELWLDTGDIEEAEKNWTSEMKALTTNNTLLNKEIQKGIYDEYIGEANTLLKDLPLAERVIEIAFILNARHGLRLVQRFGGMVSVELHTDFSHDLEGIVEYGRRFFEINADNFIIKVPYTATGLLGARKLREMNVRVNFTLEFSARQNALVAHIVKPNYLNVFLGRLNSYVADNNLGDGKFVGERATIASQHIVLEITKKNPTPTKQIAASLRNGEQLENLAGIDVFTMPTKVAKEGKETLEGNFSSRTDEVYPIELNDNSLAEDIQIQKLWEVPENVLKLGESLDNNVPQNGEELELRAREAGCEDMFPQLSEAELNIIASDGKIPKHATWAEKIKNSKIAIDTLLNLAGLASFTKDQKAMDERVRSLIS